MSTVEEARQILAQPNILLVGAKGDADRRRRHGVRTTFVRVCEFALDAIPESRPDGITAGEMRIVGTPADAEGAESAIRRARAVAGDLPLSGFSLDALVALAGSRDGLAALCARLAAAGLEAVAETPIDRLEDAAGAIQAARRGGLHVRRLTVGSSDGADPIALAARARDIQARVGGIDAFAPLPRDWSPSQPSTGYDDVKQIAVARVVADNIASIQVDWQRYGPKLAQVALTMGADDVDGVSALAGDLGRRRSPLEEIRGNIRAAGLEPVERNGRFESHVQ